MKFIIFLFVIVAYTAAMPTPSDIIIVDDIEWEQFKKQHNKSYPDSIEEAKRRQIYLESKRIVDEHNKKYDAGEELFRMGLNKFSDLTPEEFREGYLSPTVVQYIWSFLSKII